MFGITSNITYAMLCNVIHWSFSKDAVSVRMNLHTSSSYLWYRVISVIITVVPSTLVLLMLVCIILLIILTARINREHVHWHGYRLHTAQDHFQIIIVVWLWGMLVTEWCTVHCCIRVSASYNFSYVCSKFRKLNVLHSIAYKVYTTGVVSSG